MKTLSSFFKLLIYSNVFVSLCVTAFTHLTYIIYKLPQENLSIVLLMVFSFTFFTYNGQRLFRLRKKIIDTEKIGKRLKWIIDNKSNLTVLTILFGLIGFSCSYFININCFYLLIPMGIISVFYVVPIIPFVANTPTLRKIPFLKIFLIGIVWSIIIIGIPMIDSGYLDLHKSFGLRLELYAPLQVFCFVIGITLPFDIRDIKYDKEDNLKTIPNVAGIKESIVCAEVFLILSIILLYVLFGNSSRFYTLLIGHIITMSMIATTKETRKEIFFAGWIEGSVIILYSCVLIADYLYFL